MTLYHSPNIVRDGLVLYLDAANTKSYPGSGSQWSDISNNPIYNIGLEELIPESPFTNTVSWIGVGFTGTRTGSRSFTTLSGAQGLSAQNIINTGVRYRLYMDIPICNGTFQFRNNSGLGGTNLITQITSPGIYEIEFDSVDTSIYLRAATALTISFNVLSLTPTTFVSSRGGAKLSNSPTFLNNSLFFDGVDDLCRTDLPVSSINNIFTACIWFNLTSLSSSNPEGAVSKRLISADQAAGNTKWCIGADQNTNIVFGGLNGVESSLKFKIELNKIYSLTLVHNINKYSIWLNNELKINNGDSNIATPSFGNISVACRPNTADRLWTGMVSNVKFYNRILSDSEVKQNFNALRGRYGI